MRLVLLGGWLVSSLVATHVKCEPVNSKSRLLNNRKGPLKFMNNFYKFIKSPVL
jgi:hypothetical protein